MAVTDSGEAGRTVNYRLMGLAIAFFMAVIAAVYVFSPGKVTTDTEMGSSCSDAEYSKSPQRGSKETTMRLSRTDLVPVLTIVAGGAVGLSSAILAMQPSLRPAS